MSDDDCHNRGILTNAARVGFKRDLAWSVRKEVNCLAMTQHMLREFARSHRSKNAQETQHAHKLAFGYGRLSNETIIRGGRRVPQNTLLSLKKVCGWPLET